MRTIQRTISLEPMTSRLPSVWPAYLDNELYYFDDVSLKDRKYYHTSNYGMVPLNVLVPIGMVPMFKKLEEENKRAKLSWYSVSKWYHFFTEYYNLLKQYGHCNRVYTSAEDYYNYESIDKYADQMVYGADKQTYIDLDNEFAEKGGIVQVKVYDKKNCRYLNDPKTPLEAHDEHIGDGTVIVDVTDGGFYKWICKNVVPSFEIPMDYADYWHSKKLYYPDVVKWLAWFNDRYGDYSGNTDCKEARDCCECNEYRNRGGDTIYTQMRAWYNEVNGNINANKNEIGNIKKECTLPTITEAVNLQTYIDDFGELSIFSKEYEAGIDYRTVDTQNGGIDYDKGNTNPGTVATMEDGSPQILMEGPGFDFDGCHMEKGKGVWKSYTEYYINPNRPEEEVIKKLIEDEFEVKVKYFTYDINNVRYTTSAETESGAKVSLKEQMSKSYPAVTNKYGWYLIGDILYEIMQMEYAIYYDKDNPYVNGKRYTVMRDRVTNTPYVYINGNEVYADYHQSSNRFYFTYFKKNADTTVNKDDFRISDYQTFDRFNRVTLMDYIDYNGSVMTVDELNNAELIDGNKVYRINSYAVDGNGTIIYCTSDGEILASDPDTLVDNLRFEGDKLIVRYEHPFTVYPVNVITGRTVSKLADLMSYDMLVDDIGNEIDGIYSLKTARISHQPKEGETIEPLYHVGNTANIRRFSLTRENVNAIDDGKNYFVGDIITRMKFYYKSVDGEILNDTIVDVALNGNNIVSNNKLIGSGITHTSLSAINESTNKITDSHILIKDIFCDVTYNKGATLSRTEGENFVLADGMDHGVEYSETVRFVKENREYYLKKPKKLDLLAPFRRNKPESHSISYPIYVYKMTQDVDIVENSQYDTDYGVPMASFKFNILTDWNEEKKDMARFNNTEVYPTFREEYRLGSSVIENIDTDIYIERGINAAYERHLKLGEVTSLENLEKYGNNYFKMMDS